MTSLLDSVTIITEMSIGHCRVKAFSLLILLVVGRTLWTGPNCPERELSAGDFMRIVKGLVEKDRP